MKSLLTSSQQRKRSFISSMERAAFGQVWSFIGRLGGESNVRIMLCSRRSAVQYLAIQ